MIQILSTIATILSVGGNFLLAKQIKWVFPIWIVANIMWIGIILSTSRNYPQLAMYGVYVGTSVWSWISWSNKEKQAQSQA